VRPEITSRTTPNSASSGSTASAVVRPSISHSNTNCASSIRKAPTRLALSMRPRDGMTRRNGSTSQSVNANTKLPTGLPNGTRWYCMYMRSRQAPPNRPAAMSSRNEVIWKSIGCLDLVVG